MAVTAITKRGEALQTKAHMPRHRADAPYDLMIIGWPILNAAPLNGHEIDEFRDALVAKEARDERIRLRKIQLLAVRRRKRRNFKETSFVIVENRGKNTRRIKVRQATPIDRSIHSHQRHAVKITDDSVIFDGLIGHGFSCDNKVVGFEMTLMKVNNFILTQ